MQTLHLCKALRSTRWFRGWYLILLSRMDLLGLALRMQLRYANIHKVIYQEIKKNKNKKEFHMHKTKRFFWCLNRQKTKENYQCINVPFFRKYNLLFCVSQEKFWFWSDGTPLKYTNWCTGQPDNFQGNQNCAYVNWSGKSLCGHDNIIMCLLSTN